MTTQQKILIPLAVGLLFGLLLVPSYYLGHRAGYKKGWNDCIASAVPDTVWRVDTIIHEQPTEVVKWKDKVVYVPISQTDTVHHHDTTYVALQFEKKEYIDSTYKAVVSGFQPSLDWIEVYQRTQTITNTIVEKAPRWSFGVAAGPGVFWDRRGVSVGIGAVLGVQYRF